MDKMITLRTLVRTAFAGIGAAPTSARAFTLCGDESHNSEYIRTALSATPVEDGVLSIDFAVLR